MANFTSKFQTYFNNLEAPRNAFEKDHREYWVSKFTENKRPDNSFVSKDKPYLETIRKTDVDLLEMKPRQVMIRIGGLISPVTKETLSLATRMNYLSSYIQQYIRNSKSLSEEKREELLNEYKMILSEMYKEKDEKKKTRAEVPSVSAVIKDVMTLEKNRGVDDYDLLTLQVGLAANRGGDAVFKFSNNKDGDKSYYDPMTGTIHMKNVVKMGGKETGEIEETKLSPRAIAAANKRKQDGKVYIITDTKSGEDTGNMQALRRSTNQRVTRLFKKLLAQHTLVKGQGAPSAMRTSKASEKIIEIQASETTLPEKIVAIKAVAKSMGNSSTTLLENYVAPVASGGAVAKKVVEKKKTPMESDKLRRMDTLLQEMRRVRAVDDGTLMAMEKKFVEVRKVYRESLKNEFASLMKEFDM